MRLSRRFKNSALAIWLTSRLLAGYAFLVALTARYSVIGFDDAREMIRDGEPFIVVFWHSRMFMMPELQRRVARMPDFRMLVSRSRDGQLVARTVKTLGITTFAGSSSRGGFEALKSIRAALADGATVGVAPDGPRGPRMRMKAGVVSAAQRADVPIFAVTFSATRARNLKSWDRFMVPLPFSKVVFVIDGPISVGRHTSADDAEAARGMIEDRLREVTRRADELCGLRPVEPMPR